MKSQLVRSLVLTVAFAACSFASESFRPFILKLTPGSSSESVRKTLGVPSATLGKDLWVYFEFSQANPNAENPEFDTLVIAFTDGRVTDVKITDGRVVRKLLAQYQAQLAKASVAKK
ncbi:MAG: hypothetical protein Q7S40_16735 [Opitutaceae bacterium]|nr:hypothetical protein [Opitutaceae bacterium]